jgi:hypothetical protein
MPQLRRCVALGGEGVQNNKKIRNNWVAMIFSISHETEHIDWQVCAESQMKKKDYPQSTQLPRTLQESRSLGHCWHFENSFISFGYQRTHLNQIELEAECCSPDSLGAFTDHHYCKPAVTRSMHSDDTHSKMWVGSDSDQSSESYLFKSSQGSQTARIKDCLCLLLHVCHSFRPITVSFAQIVCISLRYRIRVSRPVAHTGPTAHTS